MAYDENTDRDPDYWRKRCEAVESILKMGSKELSKGSKETFKELEKKGWDWKSYYNGWLNGRVDLLLRYRKAIKKFS